jgi:hypothetical protein
MLDFLDADLFLSKLFSEGGGDILILSYPIELLEKF